MKIYDSAKKLNPSFTLVFVSLALIPSGCGGSDPHYEMGSSISVEPDLSPPALRSLATSGTPHTEAWKAQFDNTMEFRFPAGGYPSITRLT